MNENQIPTWERLTAYFDGELDRDQRLEMEQLLFENPEYARAVRDWKELRFELQSIPPQALTAGKRSDEDISRAVMDNILQNIAKGEVQWDSRPVDLEQYYKLQANANQLPKPAKLISKQWKEDFRKLHPKDRLRRWNWQLTGLASVVALLIVNVFVTQYPKTVMTGYNDRTSKIEDSGSKLVLESGAILAEADSVIQGDTLAESFDAEIQESLATTLVSEAIKSAQSSKASTPWVDNSPLLASPAELWKNSFVGSEMVTSKSGALESGMASKGSSGGVSSLDPIQQPADSEFPLVAGKASPELVEDSASDVGTQNLLVFEIDDAAEGLKNLNAVLLSNGFEDLEQQFIQQERLVRQDLDASDLSIEKLVNSQQAPIPGIVISGEIAMVSDALIEFRDQGNRISYMSQLPVLPRSVNQQQANELVKNESFRKVSPVLAQDLAVIGNRANVDIPTSNDLKEMFKADLNNVEKPPRQPFLEFTDSRVVKQAAVPGQERRKEFLPEESTASKKVDSAQSVDSLAKRPASPRRSDQDADIQIEQNRVGDETQKVQVMILLQERAR